MSEQIFLTQLQSHFENAIQKDPLKGFREKSWEQLKALGFPSKSHESFRYVHLRDFYLCLFDPPSEKTIDKSLFSHAILPECIHSHIVFIDGIYSAALSDISALPSQTVLLSLDEALRTHGSFLQSHLMHALNEEKDPFAFLNLALHQSGAFIYLPPGFKPTSPLQCVHIATGDKPKLLSPRLHLILGAHSALRCIVTSEELQPSIAHLHAPALEIFLEEEASLDLFTCVDTIPTWYLETVRAHLKKKARFHALSITFGGKVVRQSYRVHLKGENSQTHLNGLWMLSDHRTAHTHALIEHKAPHTHSMQRFKGVLKDASQSSFEGKIFVERLAQKTEAYQINNNLILNQGAVAYTKPGLEIFADDVKASHGATISQIDEEQLFYLQARGIDSALARQLLIHGFCKEMIEAIPYDSLLKKLNTKILGYI